jgi:hypothetical protein
MIGASQARLSEMTTLLKNTFDTAPALDGRWRQVTELSARLAVKATAALGNTRLWSISRTSLSTSSCPSSWTAWRTSLKRRPRSTKPWWVRFSTLNISTMVLLVSSR